MQKLLLKTIVEREEMKIFNLDEYEKTLTEEDTKKFWNSVALFKTACAKMKKQEHLIGEVKDDIEHCNGIHSIDNEQEKL